MERKINEVRILSGQTLYPAALADGSYRLCDVCIKLEGDKIYVTADQTAVAGVEIV